jgi:hypothetical protein
LTGLGTHEIRLEKLIDTDLLPLKRNSLNWDTFVVLLQQYTRIALLHFLMVLLEFDHKHESISKNTMKLVTCVLRTGLIAWIFAGTTQCYDLRGLVYEH